MTHFPSRSLAALAAATAIATAAFALPPAQASAPTAATPATSAKPDAPRPDHVAVPGTNFQPVDPPGVCQPRRGRNAQLSDNCPAIDSAWSTVSGRGQAQNSPSLAADPTNDRNVLATWVDYRSADNRCHAAFSTSGGRDWRNSPIPSGYVNGDFVGKPREYYDSTASPVPGWDSRGNAYVLCTAYNRGVASVSPSTDMSGGIYLFRSIQTKGSSWEYMPTPVAENKLLSGGPDSFSILDYSTMAIDTNPSSPNRDTIYVGWVFTRPDYTSSVYVASSRDYGRSFTKPVNVGSSSDLCVNSYGLSTEHGSCNLNLSPKLLVGRDGAVHLAWINRNGEQSSEADNKQQVVVSTSRDGGATFAAPVLGGTTYEAPDCNTYQGTPPTLGASGVACLPEKGAGKRSLFRVYNSVTGAVDPRTGRLALVYGSYINPNSREKDCSPEGLTMPTVLPLYNNVKQAGCNNDIMVSYSDNGARSFTGADVPVERGTSLTRSAGQQSTDQFWPSAAYTRGGTLVVSYRDRQYGDAQTSGGTDISVSAIHGTRISTRRVTTSTNPVPTQIDQGTFYGDNDALLVRGNQALLAWSDTRQPAYAVCPRKSPGQAPRLCTFDVNGGQANTQLIDFAHVPVR
ncbi:hypothetical protein ACQP1U_18425 [Actinomycetota bacterium]